VRFSGRAACAGRLVLRAAPAARFRLKAEATAFAKFRLKAEATAFAKFRLKAEATVVERLSFGGGAASGNLRENRRVCAMVREDTSAHAQSLVRSGDGHGAVAATASARRPIACRRR
jgi:hypothetical protein